MSEYASPAHRRARRLRSILCQLGVASERVTRQHLRSAPMHCYLCPPLAGDLDAEIRKAQAERRAAGLVALTGDVAFDTDLYGGPDRSAYVTELGDDDADDGTHGGGGSGGSHPTTRAAVSSAAALHAHLISEMAADGAGVDPMAAYRTTHGSGLVNTRIADREDSYHARHRARGLSPERGGDAFDGKTPARSYADIMVGAAVERERAELTRKLETMRAEGIAVPSASGIAAAVAAAAAAAAAQITGGLAAAPAGDAPPAAAAAAARKRRRWDDASSTATGASGVGGPSSAASLAAGAATGDGLGGGGSAATATISSASSVTSSAVRRRRWEDEEDDDDGGGGSGAISVRTATGADAAAVPRASSRWDAPTPVAVLGDDEDDDGDSALARRRGGVRAEAWGATPGRDDAVPGGAALPAAAGGRKRSRWDETPAASSGAAGRYGDATPAVLSGAAYIGATPTPSALLGAQTPAVSGMGGFEAMGGSVPAIGGVGGALSRAEAELAERNRPLTDDELDALLPVKGYRVLEAPATYVPLRTPGRKLMSTPTPIGGTPGFALTDTPARDAYGIPATPGEAAAAAAGGAAGGGSAGAALPYIKAEDMQYFGKLLDVGVDEDTLSPEALTERRIMKLLLKIKAGTPPQRKVALRQLVDKAKEFGAGPLFAQLLPLLISPSLEDQERHVLVKVCRALGAAPTPLPRVPSTLPPPRRPPRR